MQLQMALEKERIMIAKEQAELQGIPVSNEIKVRELQLKEKEIALKEYEIAQKINGDNTRIQEANINAGKDVRVAEINAAAQIAVSSKEPEEKEEREERTIQIFNQMPDGNKRVTVERTETGLMGETQSI